MKKSKIAVRFRTASPLLYGEVSHIKNDATKRLVTKLTMPNAVYYCCVKRINEVITKDYLINENEMLDTINITEFSMKRPSHMEMRVKQLLSFLYEKMDELASEGIISYSDVHPFIYDDKLPF